jgi:hypothetical protein
MSHSLFDLSGRVARVKPIVLTATRPGTIQ